MSKNTWYVAGPMSGVPQFNFPLFDTVAKALRARGYDVVSPAEMDSEEVRAHAMASPDGDPVNRGNVPSLGLTWGDFLSRDVKIIADGVAGICLLPNWYHSRGARLEAFVGTLCDRSFMLWDAEDYRSISVTSKYIESYVLGINHAVRGGF